MLLLETGRIEAIGMLAGACLGGAGGEELRRKGGREREREKKRWSPLGGG